ncbi:MarR family winged helix-turn-helix transcriptional regulator [Cribrihabitans sp. XS_ASV171]
MLFNCFLHGMGRFQHDSMGFLANHMARLFASALHRALAPLGLAPAQFMVLLELWEKDGRTQSDLVGALDVEQATMANTLKRMERDGLIARRASETDARSRVVVLTDKARALEQRAKAEAARVNAAAFEGMDAPEQEALRAQIRAVIANLRSA